MNEGGPRRRVLGPHEEAPDYYAAAAPREGLEARLPQNNTALRLAERRFRKPEAEGELIDFRAISEDGKELLVVRGAFRGRPVYEVLGCGGFLYCPEALPPSEQALWAERAVADYFGAPNPSSLDPLFDDMPQSLVGGLGRHVRRKRDGASVLIDEAFIRRLRWTTLGYPYNWTTKEYDFDRGAAAFPAELAALCAEFAACIGHEHFKAEAGIVNYYQTSDSLTSHVDRSEQNMAAPLISLSLGLDAVFLLGGRDRDDPVRAFRVRSGDISALHGESRLFFHGVPRIIPDTDPPLDAALLRGARININVRQVRC